ncbi:hypothetical protein [Lacticigenium naphthae]|uniref:hypothetical protein n=1 Tax=Lacticigenium naphthae TaxID=515351 RepID=UPI00040D973D|nr:hypothetical protein [Lacticigenium naphthae]
MKNNNKRKATVLSILGLTAVGAFALRMDDSVLADEADATGFNPGDCIQEFGAGFARGGQQITDQERQQLMEENNISEEEWQERMTTRQGNGMMQGGRGFRGSEEGKGSANGPRFGEDGQFGGMMGGRFADGESPEMSEEDYEEWIEERDAFRQERIQEVHPDWNPLEEEAVEEDTNE